MIFFYQTKNFYEDFEFNIYMFKEIKTNFFEFFCIDKNIFNEKLIKINSNFLKKNNINNIYNLKREDDAFTLFKSISYEKAYELRDISKLENLKNQQITIKYKISKDKILKMIPELSKLIEEYGLDGEWYQHLDNLSERLSLKEIKLEQPHLNEYSKSIISLGFKASTKKSYKNTILSNSSTNIINRNYNKENSKNKILNINNESFGGGQNYSLLSLVSKKNNNNIINEDNMKKLKENNFHDIKIILDRNFDTIFNLRKIGTVYFYVVDLYEKSLYKKDEQSSLIYEQKYKFSFNKKRKIEGESFGKLDIDNKDEDNKYIKAKTLFFKQSKNHLNLPDKKIDSNILFKEDSFIGEDDKIIQRVKTWASENNSIDMQKHLIKEGERIYNINDGTKVNSKNEKISANSDEKNKNLSIKNIRKNIEINTKKIGTKALIKDKEENINYNRYNIRNIKNKEDDEEIISFITKSNFEDFIKKNNSFNYYFIIILFSLFVIIIIVIVIKLALAKTNFSFTSYLTKGMIYLEEIKSDIYTSSIIVLSQCLRTKENDLPTGLSEYNLQLAIKSSDLMTHLSNFEKQLKLTQNNNLSSNIIDFLYENITIYNLNPDWSSKIEESYLLKEINYFSYLLNEQSTQKKENNKCDFENNIYILFLNFSKNSDSLSKYIYNLNKNETSFNQRLLYYILINEIYTINPILSNILDEIIIVQVKVMDTYLAKIIGINSALLLLIVLKEFLILLKSKLDINFIKYIFIFLYEYDQNQMQFEYEITYLEKTSKEFNLNNLIQLEKIKNSNNNYLNFFDNSNELLCHNDNDEININFRESLMKNSFPNNTNNKKENLIENMINKYQKKGIELEQNSISGSLFNNSMNNNSMIQLLNKNKGEVDRINSDNKKNNNINNMQNNKNKKLLKNDLNNNIGLNENKKIFKENEETLELLKANNKIIPSPLFITIYISLIFSAIFILIIVLNMIDIYKKRDLWEYAINLSMNYLEKIPKIIELGLSTYLSVILGNTNLQRYKTIEEYPKYQPKYMTYFTSMKNYENSELISNNIKDSFFANELYDNYRLKKNIEFCENDEFFKDYFLDSKKLNKYLNEQNNFCINSALEGSSFFNSWITTFDTFLDYVSQIALACRNENIKISESGLDLEIDLILHELTYLYIDFEERKKSNLTFARNQFFENENFIRMLKDMNIPFTLAIGSLFSVTDKDLNQLNKKISFYETVFIIITLFVDIFFLCFLIAFILYNEKTKKTLVFIGQIIKKE